MNELIKQLAEQATTEEHDGFRYLDKRKFAELIVKEVTNIVLHYTNVDEGVAVAKKHFGVEE
jgi:hypothetical protein